jgi:uncharacterized protein
LHGQMRPGNVNSRTGFWKELIINILLLIIGYVLFDLVQYVPYMASGGGLITWPSMALGGIFLFQIIAIFIILGIVMTYFYRKTGHIYVGAFMSSFFVTWIIAASQAIQYLY